MVERRLSRVVWIFSLVKIDSVISCSLHCFNLVEVLLIVLGVLNRLYRYYFFIASHGDGGADGDGTNVTLVVTIVVTFYVTLT